MPQGLQCVVFPLVGAPASSRAFSLLPLADEPRAACARKVTADAASLRAPSLRVRATPGDAFLRQPSEAPREADREEQSCCCETRWNAKTARMDSYANFR